MTNEERVAIIKEKLQTQFKPSFIEVIDESYKHVGHAGAKTGLGHFKLRICSQELNQLTPIKAHRAVYAALGDLMTTDIHALSIELTTS